MNIQKQLFRNLLGLRLPITDGSVSIPGIGLPVTIRRDKWGIPHIEAETDYDAWYGLGFCQGQDRTFQLECLLRAVRGTLSELVGRTTLPVDRFVRRIGFFRSAERQIKALDPEIRKMLEAFAAGISSGSSYGLRRRPHEFAVLRSNPTPWTSADILGVAKLQSFAMASNWDMELARIKVLSEDGPEALAALDPAYPYQLPEELALGPGSGKAIDGLIGDIMALARMIGMGGGSNSWALAGQRTNSGRPLLANDPHLSPILPPHWYLAHVVTPKWSVAGATLAGSPAFAAGHNGYCAWGMTAGLVDNTDLFLEEIGPDRHSVRQGDAFVPCEVRTERIKVRGGRTVTEDVMITPRGPLIGPALQGESGAVSMRAVWLDPLPARGLLHAHRVRSFQEFREVLAEWPVLSLNMLYADASGRIGWQLAGQAPQRRKGWGTIPLPGWDPEAGWEESFVPFGEMPHKVDPASGLVASANNQPFPSGEGPFLGIDWLDSYRVDRISEVLTGRQDWDIAGMQDLQIDQQSRLWGEIRGLVLSAQAKDLHAQRAQEILHDWDGLVKADSTAASIFEFFLSEMAMRIAVSRAPRSWQWAQEKGFAPLISYTYFGAHRRRLYARRLKEQPEGWFPCTWDEEIASALSTVVQKLEAKYGKDSKDWAWGSIRTLTLQHAFGSRKPLDRVFNLGPIEWGGDNNTPSQASVNSLDPAANPGVIASMRMVVDVGAWEDSRFSLPGGQSGNPLSPHYSDLFPLWQRGEGVPIPWSEEDVKQAAVHTLRLYPVSAR